MGCKVLHFFHMYMLGCNYFWMLCEGIYLHTLIVVAVFAEEQHLHWYYLLGWGEWSQRRQTGSVMSRPAHLWFLLGPEQQHGTIFPHLYPDGDSFIGPAVAR